MPTARPELAVERLEWLCTDGQQTGYVYGVSTSGGRGIDPYEVVSITKWPDHSGEFVGEQETSKPDALDVVVEMTDLNGGSVHAIGYWNVGFAYQEGQES